MTARKALTALGLITLVAALLLPDGVVSCVLIGLCVGASLVILWRNLPALSDLEPENPKVGVLKQATLFAVVVIAALLFIAWGAESSRFAFTPGQIKWAMAVLFAAIILIFGNLAPKLPWNRYTGLRLPWTVRDEQTWLVAHRMLGWLSLPFGSLALAAGASPGYELSIKALVGVLLVWIAIPAVLSLVFWMKKYGKNQIMGTFSPSCRSNLTETHPGGRIFMKKPIWITLGAAALLLALTLGMLAANGLGLRAGRVIITENGAFLLMNGDPVRLIDKAPGDPFAACATGDRVLALHGPVAESYPGQTVCRLLLRLQRGTIDHVPATLIAQLEEMGYRLAR